MNGRAEPRDAADDGFNDPDIRTAIDAAPKGMPYSDVEAMLIRRFGPDRAWSRDKIMRYWHARHPTGRVSKTDADPEIAAFVNDRLGRMSVQAIAAAAKARFGDRAPSKSAIHRHWQRLRPRLRS